MLRIVTLPLFVLALGSSCLIPKEYVYLPAKTSCLQEPPPKLRPVVATMDESCPLEFSLCLSVDAGLDFEHNLELQKRWMSEAWIRCGVLSSADGGVPDGGF